MSKLPSQEEYERIKNEYKARAKEKEKLLSSDLVAVRNDLLPKYLKGKFLTGCAIFATTYMAEELIFRKKVPGLVKFVGAVSATVAAPKLYRLLYENYFEVKSESPLNEPIPTHEESFPVPPEPMQED
uniref:Uncharacterized protein n=1 Tax=Roseihalotalea indica TaxID=2867963 RepID=A0AA49GMB9_9BACT|nr:hypothetical protein K4G66_28965 [Tunicatimonas sp. TK19036]